MIGTASNRANFENRVIYAHFWPISPYKTPKSKSYGDNGQYVSKKNLYLSSSYIKTIGLQRPAHKMRFSILRSTLIFTYQCATKRKSNHFSLETCPYFRVNVDSETTLDPFHSPSISQDFPCLNLTRNKEPIFHNLALYIIFSQNHSQSGHEDISDNAYVMRELLSDCYQVTGDDC